MEASALPDSLGSRRAPLSAAFLRLRSDEQLVALFRGGSEDAFRAIHDRYRGRLLAYARQMLHGALGDPEDALQDVFIRAYRALRANDRPVSLRAWLYRIAHNRCVDELRRPCPVPSELSADAQPAFSAPAAEGAAPAVAERSAMLARLVADVQGLPEQQRSALLMRELQGLSYAELGSALGVSVPAVKSLLLRARTGLIDISVARETPCGEIRAELIEASDRSVRISGRARRHCAECAPCESYRGELRRVRRGFAALTPSGPLGQLGMLFGLGGGGGAAAASGGGGAAAAGGAAIAGATAAKIAVAVCCAALLTTAGRAVIATPSSHATTRTAPTSHSATVAAPVAHIAAAPLIRHASSPTQQPASTAGGGHPNVSLGSVGNGGGGQASSKPSGGAGIVLAPGGPTGPSGSSGATGYLDGIGATAATGASGASGSTGSSGASGSDGAVLNGIGGQGAAAVEGPDPSPTTGASGASGPTGASGAVASSVRRSDGGTSVSY